MTPSVTPTQKTNTHHITLEELDDATTKYGLVIAQDGRAIERRPRVGSNHVPFTQNDWSGGRGLKFATDDRSRFGDSKRLNTRRAGLVSLGGLEYYTAGHRQAEQFLPQNAQEPGGITWQAVTGANRWIAFKVTASASGNRSRIYFWVRRRGTPSGPITAWLMSNAAGDPDTTLKTISATTSQITDTVSVLYEFTFTSSQAVTATTDYHVVVSANSGDTDANHWEVGTEAARSQARTRISANGSAGTWSNASYDLYYRLVDDLDIAGATFFTYKSQLYMVTRPTAAAAPKLYINGYRGVATGAGQSRTILKDSTQTFPTSGDGLIGRVLLIIDGPNSEWQQPYKVITANDADEITTASWGRAHVAAQTIYCVLGTDVWIEITGHGLTALPTDVKSAGDVLYFAQGDFIKMRRMQEINLAGVWTRTFAEEDNYAKLLLVYRDNAARGTMIMKANDYDNSNQPSVATAKAEAWGTRLKFPYLINACEVTTNWTGGASTTITADTALYKTGSASIKAAVGAGAANTFAYYSIAAGLNIYRQKKIRMWVYTSTGGALDAGVLKLRVATDTALATPAQTDVDFPPLEPGEWTQVEFPLKGNVHTIKSIGVIKTIATAFNLYIDGIETVPLGSEVQLGNDMERINGLELYGDPAVPMVFRSGSVGSIENGTFVPLPLQEYTNLEGVFNGAGHAVMDVYLFFSFLQGIEQYYRANLDDIGPNKDEGMPLARQGYATSMIGYADRLLTNYDAGNDGYSSIMSLKGGGYHEDYRSDTPGKRIRSIFVQIIPGFIRDRLWFCEGEDILYLPMPGNTVNELTDASYRFTHEGVLELGWIGDDEQRLFSTIKLTTENIASTRPIEVDYKLDEATAWTPLTDSVGTIQKFTTGPTQTLNLMKTGNRLKVRLRPQTNNKAETPRITRITISTTAQPDIRYSYSMQFYYYDNAFDLLNQKENYSRAETLLNQLDDWAADKTPLLMRSNSELYDNRIVFLEPLPVGVIGIVVDEQQEKQQGTLTATEPL